MHWLKSPPLKSAAAPSVLLPRRPGSAKTTDRDAERGPTGVSKETGWSERLPSGDQFILSINRQTTTEQGQRSNEGSFQDATSSLRLSSSPPGFWLGMGRGQRSRLWARLSVGCAWSRVGEGKGEGEERPTAGRGSLSLISALLPTAEGT